jgi:dihydrolipoamide dehydrogenase
MLFASERFEEAGHAFPKMGIKVGKPELDLPTLLKFKDQAVDGNTKGVAFLFKKNKIDPYFGTGRILSAGKVEVKGADGKTQVLETKNIVIATGSDVAKLKGIEIDEKRIVSSTGALTLEKVPGKLLVVGAGIIGLELGSVWRRLGAQITVVEFLDRILPGMDGEVARQFQRLLEKQGVTFKLGAKVTGVDTSGKTMKVSVEPAAGGAGETVEADVVLVSIGRVPYTEGLGLKEAGVAVDDRGRVEIDPHFATNVQGIYAIGDVVRGAMLAHKAEDEGIAVAEIIAGQAGHVNYDAIPGVVYTSPEVASVGKTEEELKAAGVAYNVGKFPFTANGRAKSNQQADGFVKFLADARTDRVLGVHIVGVEAGEMIHECTLLIEFGGSSEDLARTCHAHPTRSEAVKEAAMNVAKRAIHM